MMVAAVPDVARAYIPSDAAAFERMDLRLKTWGAWSRSGGIRPDLWDSDPPASGTILTRDDIADAWAMQCMIVRLPAIHRITLAVHYVHRHIEREPWREVNARLSRLARCAFESVPLISRQEYQPIRDRAVRMLILAEGILTNAVESVSSPSIQLSPRSP